MRKDTVRDSTAGTVYLVGAGPGDPELLTLLGAKLLGRADAVVHDALTHPALLERAPRSAERFDVGKRAGHPSVSQTEINLLLIRLARQHGVVVRLKGGDSFVFGRGGEEGIALDRAGIPFQVVPGVTSAIGALGYAGIPLTHRGVASSVAFVTGHRAGATAEATVEGMNGRSTGWSGADTIVVFMGLRRLGRIARELIAEGRSATTPTAVVDRGTLPGQRTVVGTLGDIDDRVRRVGLHGPALIVVGEVVRLRSRLHRRREEDGPVWPRSIVDPPDPGRIWATRSTRASSAAWVGGPGEDPGEGAGS